MYIEGVNTKRLEAVTSREYLTVEEAAKVLSIGAAAVRNYLSSRQLTTYKFKTLTLISVKEIKKWKNEKSRR